MFKWPSSLDNLKRWCHSAPYWPANTGRGGDESSEGCCHLAVVFDEVAIKIGKPQEPLELLDGNGSGPLDCSLGLLKVSLKSPALDEVPQECDRGTMKLTFFSFYKWAVLQKSLQDMTGMESVLSEHAREYQDVVQINKPKVIKEVPENTIEDSLKHIWGIGEAERHD